MLTYFIRFNRYTYTLYATTVTDNTNRSVMITGYIVRTILPSRLYFIIKSESYYLVFSNDYSRDIVFLR